MVNFSPLLALILATSLYSSPVQKTELSTERAAVGLLEIWDCGPEKFKRLSKLAEISFNQCPDLKDSANMCCKAHDYCYETHEVHNFTHEFCDFRFCGCLQDAQDLHTNTCNLQLNTACNAVKSAAGGRIFADSHPRNETVLAATYGSFKDARPLGMNMQPLVEQCGSARGMAIHCHNSAQHCLEQEKRRNEAAQKRGFREGAHSSHDCRSIMYECLQVIGDSKDIEPCPSLARQMSAQLRASAALSGWLHSRGRETIPPSLHFTHSLVNWTEDTHGKSAIEIYPIVSGRLLQSCKMSKEPIESCLKTFDSCAVKPENREEKPEQFSAARRVKIVCHQALKTCIEEATEEETKDDRIVEISRSLRRKRDASKANEKIECMDAKYMALSRIRHVAFDQKEWGWNSVLSEGAARAYDKYVPEPIKNVIWKIGMK